MSDEDHMRSEIARMQMKGDELTDEVTRYLRKQNIKFSKCVSLVHHYCDCNMGASSLGGRGETWKEVERKSLHAHLINLNSVSSTPCSSLGVELSQRYWSL